MRRLKAQLMNMFSGKSKKTLDSINRPDSATNAPKYRQYMTNMLGMNVVSAIVIYQTCVID